jgi:hypothetical protein
LGVKRILLHIGMPRAASTFFQAEVFPNIHGFEFWGVEQTQYQAAFQKLLYQDDSVYNPFDIQLAIGFPYHRELIVSNELFVGQSLYLASTNRSRTSRRLKQVFPNAEIILFLRNQTDLLESLYSIGVYSGLSMKPEDFVRFSDEFSDVEHPLYPTFYPAEHTESYRYSALIRLYIAQYEKVHVFLFEDFKKDPRRFMEHFTESLAIQLESPVNYEKPRNPSLSARQLGYLRQSNRFKEVFGQSSLGERLFRKNVQVAEHYLGGKEKFRFNPTLRQQLKAHFKADNEEVLSVVPALQDSSSFSEYYL